MKRFALILGVFTLLLPMAAWADGITIANQFGTVTITTGGVVSTGAELVSYNGVTAPKPHSLGFVSFSTGALSSGSIWTGGTFSSTGSTFDVTSGGGGFGQPAKGVIFQGSFVGPITWTLVSKTGQFNYVFTLSGEIQGKLANGRVVTGTTTQTIYVYENQWMHDNKGLAWLGSSQLAVPEPGTLSLLGTGLIALVGGVRRRFSAP